MEKSDLIDKFSNILSVRQGTAEDLVDGLIAAVKEECCSGSQRWEIAADFKVRVAEPELIQGYTAEQWQEIIDGGYLCEFGIFGCNHSSRFGILKKIDGSRYVDERGIAWINCRPAQIKGVMRPIFVEPVDKEAWCVFMWLDTEGGWGIKGDGQWDEFKKENSTAYIEV